MIGNDIVDLKLAAVQSNWQRRGFLDKVFSEFEKQYILNSNDPFKTVWLLWSMKESAYKAYLQKFPKRFFNPKKIECRLMFENKWIVKINEQVFKVKSRVTPNYIHSTATLNENDLYDTNCFITGANYTEQHLQSCTKLRTKVAEKKGVSKNTLRIKKDVLGIPKIYKNNRVLETSFSISHHGNYGAYAILN